MVFRSIEIINVVLCAYFIFAALRHKNPGLPFLLFVYGSLYFSYAAIPALGNGTIVEIRQIHIEGSGILATLSGILILLLTLLLSAKQTKGRLLEDKGLFYLFFGVTLAIIVGYLVHQDHYLNILALKGTLGLVLMTALMFLFVKNHSLAESALADTKIWSVLALLVLAVGVAIYELYSLRVWSFVSDSNGDYIYRPSSLLFNPNLFGMWCAMLAIGFAYFFHREVTSRRLILFGLVLSFVGIYLSSSRSAGFLVLLTLIGISTLIRGRNFIDRWAPVMAMVAVFMLIGLGANWASYSVAGQEEHWRLITLLGERFASYPMQVGHYFSNKFGLAPEAVPAEISISIEGRFTGEMRDSGWLVAYDDMGWVGALALAVLYGMFLFWGFKTWWKRRDIDSIYALAILFFCVGTGVVIRFQMFPLAMFVPLILAPCISYWRNALGVSLTGEAARD